MKHLAKEALPESLWAGGIYRLPPGLMNSYEFVLENNNMLLLAKQGSQSKKIYGGLTLEETNEHFMFRFCASVVRTQQLFCDPNNDFGNLPTALLQVFSSHRVAIMDIPCGAGATVLSLLAVLYEYRLAGIVPRLPLNVDILAGDFSAFAQNYYSQLTSSMLASLSTMGIKVAVQFEKWDATSLASTDSLCQKWDDLALRAQRKLILVSNFSGDGKLIVDKIHESIRYIGVRAARQKSLMLWIEPGDNGGLDFLKKIGRSLYSFFATSSIADKPDLYSSQGKWWYNFTSAELPVKTSVQVYHGVQI